MEVHAILKELAEANGVAGAENAAADVAAKHFEPYVHQIKRDLLGNLVAYKKGVSRRSSRKRQKVFVAAHLDEIGLMVNEISENGFIRFTPIGGFDPRTLWGQTVIVHGRKDLFGVIGPKSPHLVSSAEIQKEMRIEDMHIDVAMPVEQTREIVRVGDIISIHRHLRQMKDSSYLTGKALDDRAGVMCLIYAASELQSLVHQADVYFVGTVQEEVGARGAVTSTYELVPDIGIAVDVCHGNMPGVDQEDTAELGKGPAIAVGPNIHQVLSDKLQKLAGEFRIPFALEPSPGATPTDARSIQVSREGVPCALLSIPLRYMHTSVEMVHTQDIVLAGRLLAQFIAEVNENFLQEVCSYE